MSYPFTTSNISLVHPGMNYTFLQQEGIKLIEQLASNYWTNYNASDPGITILEALCYAITDLSYRLSFSIEELVASPLSEINQVPLFLSALNILTINSLTHSDYRKLILDIEIDGIRLFKNVWLEPIVNPQPSIFYDAKNAKLTFNNLDPFNLVEPVYFKGLYRILLEKCLSPDQEKDSRFQSQNLIEEVNKQLNRHRNLCEDFAEIKILDIEEITVQAEIEITDYVNPNELIVQIYDALARTISPAINFLSLPEMLDRGISVEDIFAGPKLRHGFIDDAQLEQFQRRTELRTSDLVHALMDLPGVKAVRSITTASSTLQGSQTWVLALNPELTPQLTLKDGDITFYKGQIGHQHKINENQKNAILQVKGTAFPIPSVQDLPIPIGDYRELSEYESLQTEFPMIYGIGELGSPASDNPLRKAQTKQLQAYLIVFDQILANYFAQLDHARELFALGNAEVKTYFTQSIAHFPGAKEILQDSGTTYLSQLQEDPAVACGRKTRLLEHLLAQYGETLIDYSLLFPDTSSPETAIQNKANFVKNYRQLSAERGQAINYMSDSNQAESVFGFKQRIAHLLAIEPEDFYVVEHILLRPRPTLPNIITQFSQSNFPDDQPDKSAYVTCTSPQHGLQQGEKINIIYSSSYNGIYTVSNVQENTFDIQATFVADHLLDKDAWEKSELLSLSKDQHPDPFSFQISVIFSTNISRFQDESSKQVIYDALMAETPAHITIYVHWFDMDKMSDFRTNYSLLLQYLSDSGFDNPASRAAAKVAAARLIDSLGLGSTKIPLTPELLGYMVIGDASKGSPRFVVA